MADALTIRRTFRVIRSDIQRISARVRMRPPLRLILLMLYPNVVALVFYRWSRFFHVKGLRPVAWGLWCLNTYLTGADIAPDAEIGESFLLGHPVGTVIARSRIGRNVTVYGQAGIGGGGKGKTQGDDSPTIGDHVLIGVRPLIMGLVTTGDRAIIGACSLVMRDVPPDVTVAGVPARTIESFSTNQSRSSRPEGRSTEVIAPQADVKH